MKTNISWNGVGRFWNLHTLWAKILTYICRWFCFLLTHFSGFALDAARGLLCQTRACGCYKCVIYDGPMWLWLLGQTSSGLKRSTCSYSKFEVQKVYYPFIVYTFTQQTWHFWTPDWQPLAASTVLREYYVLFFCFCFFNGVVLLPVRTSVVSVVHQGRGSEVGWKCSGDQQPGEKVLQDIKERRKQEQQLQKIQQQLEILGRSPETSVSPEQILSFTQKHTQSSRVITAECTLFANTGSDPGVFNLQHQKSNSSYFMTKSNSSRNILTVYVKSIMQCGKFQIL